MFYITKIMFKIQKKVEVILHKTYLLVFLGCLILKQVVSSLV